MVQSCCYRWLTHKLCAGCRGGEIFFSAFLMQDVAAMMNTTDTKTAATPTAKPMGVASDFMESLGPTYRGGWVHHVKNEICLYS